VPQCFRPTALAIALVVVLPAKVALAADGPDWSLCGVNTLFEFYTPGLPTEVDRTLAPTDFDAVSVGVEGPPEARIYRLEGAAVVQRGDQRVAGEVLRYDAGSGVVEAEGAVTYQDRTLLLGADRARSDTRKDATRLDNVSFQLLAARGNGTARSAELLDRDHAELTMVSFSTCNPDQRDWEITADRMKLDQSTGTGYAHDMRLRFKDVTLLRLPYATFPIDDRRRSGFLLPSIGASNNGGFDFAVPYYLNLAPNYDATLVPRVITDRGFMAGGELRYLDRTQRVTLSGDYLPDDDEADRDRWSYRVTETGTYGPNFFSLVDINKVSDNRYFEDFGDSLSSAATSLLPSTAYLHGRGEWWNIAFGGDDFDVTDPTLAPGSEPYTRLPRFTANLDYRLADWARVGLDTELVAFEKDAALDGDRYDVTPWVSFPIERAAWYLRPRLAYRQTDYDLDGATEGSPDRGLPITSLDAGMYFDRATRWGDRPLRQTLEPRLYYLNVPYRNQDELPIFDTQELTFGFAQLFRNNRYTGADRQQDANQLALALSTRVIDDSDGRELVRASIGQIRYFEDQEVQLPGVAPTDDEGSELVGEIAFERERWGFAWAQQYDPEDDNTTLSSVRAQYRFGDAGVANAAYRYRRDEFEQVDFSAAIPVSERVRLIGRWNWSLPDDQTLETFAGIEYESCCYEVRFLGRRYVRNTEGDYANAVYLELELKGLGSLGRRSGDFLRRAILGYR